MTPEDRKLLLSEIINTAQELKNYLPDQSLGRPGLQRIIRIAKRLYIDAIKQNKEDTPLPPAG